MNQKRTHHMLQTLARDFKVDLATPVYLEAERMAASKALEAIGGSFFELTMNKQGKNSIKKHGMQIVRFMSYYLAGCDREYTNSKRYSKRIIALIHEGEYAVVISNYWEGSFFFLGLGDSTYKVLDPHYAVAENCEVLPKKGLAGLPLWLEKRKLRKSIKLEKAVIAASDLLLPLSKRNLEEFKKIAPNKPILLIPDGNEVEFFASFPAKPDPNIILFYGAMGSAQNVNACQRLIARIFPSLKAQFPNLRLLIVGNRPPAEIRSLNDGENVVVTGFVEDVRPWLAQAWISIIPLELGSGFRGRVIELMAMGVPVVGTHNALDSIGMENKIHGFVCDSDEEMIKHCLELLKNHKLRMNISRSSVDFVRKNYSLDSTFGKLNAFLKSIPIENK